MNLPDTYKGDHLRYEKIPCPYDPDLDMMDLIERTLIKEISEKGPRQVFVLARTWEGERSFGLPSVPEDLVDRTVEWLHDLDVISILMVGILSPGQNPDYAMDLQKNEYETQ